MNPVNTAPDSQSKPQSEHINHGSSHYCSEKTTRPFACHQCGDCCRGWTVTTTAGHVHQLSLQAWVQALLKTHQTTFRQLSQKMWALPKTASQACLFLSPDNQCLIQQHMGWQHKPKDCQKFPFAMAETETSISYACSAASKALMNRTILIAPSSLQQNVTLTTLEIPHTISVSNGVWPFTFWRFNPLTSAQWRTRMTEAFQWLGSHQLSSWQFLRGVHQVWRFPVSTPIAQVIQVNPLSQINGSLHGPEPEGWMIRLGLAMLLRKRYRTYDWISIVLGGVYYDACAFQQTLPVSEILTVQFKEQAYPAFQDFLRALITRSVLFCQGYTVMDLLMLATAAWFLTPWHARVLAWKAQRDEVNAEDLTQAIALTERHYTAHHTGFMARFHYSWLDRLFWGWVHH